MVSPASRRRAVSHLVVRGFSRVCACRVCRICRASSRREPKGRSPGLREKVLALAAQNPRYGFRRVHALLPGVNLKAVHRVWKEEGLRLGGRKRRRLVVPKSDAPPLTGPGQAWCLDFLHERLQNGRQARVLAVLDCFTRECLLLRARPSFPAFEVQRELEWLFLVHGRPASLVSDNGPEFRALSVDAERRFIQPGKPWQNGFVESFFGKLRDELLCGAPFACGAELQAALDDFLEHYNDRRPHLGLGGLTPKAFKEALQAQNTQEGVLL
jgi:putative transposase